MSVGLKRKRTQPPLVSFFYRFLLQGQSRRVKKMDRASSERMVLLFMHAAQLDLSSCNCKLIGNTNQKTITQFSKLLRARDQTLLLKELQSTTKDEITVALIHLILYLHT
jgi:hypothetical protein